MVFCGICNQASVAAAADRPLVPCSAASPGPPDPGSSPHGRPLDPEHRQPEAVYRPIMDSTYRRYDIQYDTDGNTTHITGALWTPRHFMAARNCLI